MKQFWNTIKPHDNDKFTDKDADLDTFPPLQILHWSWKYAYKDDKIHCKVRAANVLH